MICTVVRPEAAPSPPPLVSGVRATGAPSRVLTGLPYFSAADDGSLALTQTSTTEPAASCAAPPPSTGTDTGLRSMASLVPSADLGNSSPGRTSRRAKVPGAMSWSAATYEGRSTPSCTSTRLTSVWVTGWPGTRLAAAAYIGTVSSAAAMALAPTVMDNSTSTTPTTRRLSRHDGLCSRVAVGLGSSAMFQSPQQAMQLCGAIMT